MPANLTPVYHAAEQEYKAATTPAERVAALERMLAVVPKHKGTEKIQADLKRRLARERNEAQKKGGVAHAPPFWLIPAEGAGQVALVGAPNAGKSRLVAALTHARVEVAEWPFSTRVPVPGMMPVDDVQVQLLDLPPVCAESSESWMPEVLRLADASILVVDAGDPDVLGRTDFILTRLTEWDIPDPILMLGTKLDLERARQDFGDLLEFYPDRFPALAVSADTGEGLVAFARTVFELLDVVRVYTKRPGHPAELNRPWVLPRGATVEDAAAKVHHDFLANLKFARRFHRDGSGGLMVERTHTVEDGDVLEFHV
jgi:hypothetical protein